MRRISLRVSAITQKAFRVTSVGLALLLGFLLVAAVGAAMPVPVSAAIEQRGAVTTGTSILTDLTIDKPSGVVAGDLMIANIAKVGNDTTAPTSTGWTPVDGISLGSPASYGAVLYRVVDGSEKGSFDFALGAGTISAVGSIVGFSGVDTSGSTPFDVAPGTILIQASQTAVAAPSITTASANAAVVMLGQAAASSPSWSGWTTTSPGQLTELYDNQIGGLLRASVGAAWAIKPTTGPTGLGAATLSHAEQNGAILLALKPFVPATSLTVAPATGTYGGTASLTATMTPALAGETIDFTLNGVGAGSAVTDSSGVANIPAASLAGIDSGNYVTGVYATFAGDADYGASNCTASLQVNSRNIVVTANDNDKVYGCTDPTFTYKVTSGSLVSGDSFSGAIARAAGEHAGTYAIQQGTLELNSNYSLTFVNGTFNIRVRGMVIAADNLTKDYGAELTFTGTAFHAVGLVGSDTVSRVTLTSNGAAASAAAGTYDITPSNAVGTGLSNYNIVYAKGTLTVQQKNLASTIPFVSWINPDSAHPGDTLKVTIGGVNISGATAVDFGSGVRVNSFAVDSPTQITANITVNSTELGHNDIVVTTPLGDGRLSGGFGIETSTETSRAHGFLWLWILVGLAIVGIGLLAFALVRRGQKNTTLPPASTQLAQQSPEPVPTLVPQQSLEPTPASVSQQSLEPTKELETPQPEPSPTKRQPARRTTRTPAATTPNRSRRVTKKKPVAAG